MESILDQHNFVMSPFSLFLPVLNMDCHRSLQQNYFWKSINPQSIVDDWLNAETKMFKWLCEAALLFSFYNVWSTAAAFAAICQE